MRPRHALKVIPLALLVGQALALTPISPYCNPRFGYCVSLPVGLVALPPPENGDGQSWRSRDGQVQLSVWGSYGPGILDLKTPAVYADWLARAEKQGGSRVTYRFVGRNSVVLSGYTQAGRVFYQKSLLSKGSESAVRIEYPPRLKTAWDPWAAQVAASLTPPK